MRTIRAAAITETVAKLCIQANTRLPGDIVAALDAARPSSQAVKAAASRRYFSMVAGLFSSHTRRCLNAWSCSPVMV